jgi:glutathione S-transferase
MTTEFYIAAFITLLITLLTLATQVSVVRARKKFSIPIPQVTKHVDFEKYLQAHADQIEQNIIFLPILWIASSFVSWVYILLIGLIWIVFRGLYIRGFIKNNIKLLEYSGKGYMYTQIALCVLIFFILIAKVVVVKF